MKVSAAQARWFRIRRSGLIEPFATPSAIARQLIGVQAQMPAAADIAFFNRGIDVSPATLKHERLEARTVVRMWGQRNTVHIYAAEDWPLLHTVLRDRESVMERRLQKVGLWDSFQRLVSQLEKRVSAGEPLTYKDARSCEDFEKLVAHRNKWTDIEATPRGAGWVLSYAAFLRLVLAGVVCHGPDQGAESTFVHRESWLPDLQWSLPDEDKAFAELACRYLATYGPSPPRDLASWFGTTVTNAKRWVEAAGERIIDVEVDGKAALMRVDDAEDLAATAPAPAKWPIRLLHRFDPYVLGAIGSKDKNWLIDPSHYKKVWRPGAHVEAVVLVGGRIAGTWRYDKKTKGLAIGIKPFEPFSRTVARAVEKQAKRVAKFLGLDLLGIST